ncbi:MAG: hypothetical protein PGN16_04355 [Sphingomonas phyllosphaerae]|uniref:hypothetical protein n=1 Tax=Sphingomonas phyllosphaerae TaxID=257003 RepID=UPI002FF6E93B
MTAVHVTHHAAQRYVERVNGNLTLEEAAEAIRGHASAIEAAAAFGCRVVKTSSAKLILEGRTVVTVMNRHWLIISQPRGHA